MFIKRAKSRPSLRAREQDDQSDMVVSKDHATTSNLEGEEETSGGVMERKKVKGKERRKEHLKSGGPRLSFGNDGEDGSSGFKPRKSLLSQQVKLAPLLSAENEVKESVVTYSSDYLEMLKASTPSRGPKPATVEIENGEDNAEDEDSTGLSRLAREKYSSKIVEDSTAGIPDAAAIASAKMKRQAAVGSQQRGLGDIGEDYISLGGTQMAVYDGDKGLHPESRLMREEDEGEEGDEGLADYTEENEKIYLGKNANKVAARRHKGEMNELIAEREAEDEDDEETREWEEAQARRAGRWEEQVPEKKVQKGYQPAPIPRIRPMPTISAAQARVAKALSQLQAQKAQDEANLEVVVKELATFESQERELRSEVERLEGKREWVEEFRGWVEMLGNFLEDKVPKLEEIEKDALHHYRERSRIISQRRELDDQDDLALCFGISRPTEVTQVDELGRERDMLAEAGPSSIIRRARRDERQLRKSRRKERSSRQVKPSVEEEEGFSTDSTLAEGDMEDYRTALVDLDKRVRGLLDDVKAEDFKDPNLGLAVRFADWRKRYEEEYVNAFGGLGLVHAWEFWARGEMVGWEPFRSSEPIHSFHWFTSIYKYNRPSSITQLEDEIEDEIPLGPEGDLIPELISKVVVPLLVNMLENGAYDPYSSKQTRRAGDLLDMIGELIGKENKKFQSLLKALLETYHTHLLSLSHLISSSSQHDSIPPPTFSPESRLSMERFLRRRLKFLRNILQWRHVVPSEIRELCARLVGEVLRPILSRNWDGGGREMALKVLQISAGILPSDLQSFLLTGPLVK
ncbi:hypothetical protein M231_06390 [Tremella mesenterica]|uniref:GC-rich sequence DNA-binding factor n=1 Tax=Tremella mesenterica TaxID=5217 RepID=A0A4Q1BGD6_TREME|nr:hypothetical protein M231_06390 [Tremella mesenterica]